VGGESTLPDPAEGAGLHAVRGCRGRPLGRHRNRARSADGQASRARGSGRRRRHAPHRHRSRAIIPSWRQSDAVSKFSSVL
jgi:hypothetical protein